MIDTFAFYVKEMIAALILFTALFVVIGGAILIVFLSHQAYRVVFDRSEVRLRSFGHFASRVYETYHPAYNKLAVVRRLVSVLTALFKSYVSARIGIGMHWQRPAITHIVKDDDALISTRSSRKRLKTAKHIETASADADSCNGLLVKLHGQHVGILPESRATRK
jgi:hypothetical protein